jgi:hypothetical protein
MEKQEDSNYPAHVAICDFAMNILSLNVSSFIAQLTLDDCYHNEVVTYRATTKRTDDFQKLQCRI